WTLDVKAMAPAMPRARTVMWGILRIAGVSPVTGCAASQCSRACRPSSPPELALPDPRRGAHYTVLQRVVNVRSGTRPRKAALRLARCERVTCLHVRVRAHPYPRPAAVGHAAAGGGAVGGLCLGDLALRRHPARADARVGRADRGPRGRRPLAAVAGRRPLAAPAERAVPARGLGAPAGQPGVPAGLRPARRAGDGPVALPGAVL